MRHGKRHIFFLYLPHIFCIVIFVTTKKEKEQPRPKFVLSLIPPAQASSGIIVDPFDSAAAQTYLL